MAQFEVPDPPYYGHKPRKANTTAEEHKMAWAHFMQIDHDVTRTEGWAMVERQILSELAEIQDLLNNLDSTDPHFPIHYADLKAQLYWGKRIWSLISGASENAILNHKRYDELTSTAMNNLTSENQTAERTMSYRGQKQ